MMEGRGLVNGERELTIEVDEVGVFEVEEVGQGPRIQRQVRVRNRYINIRLELESEVEPQDLSLVTRGDPSR